MSHVKNVQAFGKLTGICTGYGGQYNPGQQNLQVNALITLLNNAQQSIEAVSEAQTVYDNATNSREIAFDRTRRLGSRICSILKSSGADALTLQDARASCRKLWGWRLSRSQSPKEVGTPAEKPSSPLGYGVDFASMEYHFARLVDTLAAEPKYRPNEAELSIAGLNQVLLDLHAANAAVTLAEINLAAARRKRNDKLYRGENNMVATARAAKLYLRGVFGFMSPQHTEVVRLQFSNLGA